MGGPTAKGKPVSAAERTEEYVASGGVCKTLTLGAVGRATHVPWRHRSMGGPTAKGKPVSAAERTEEYVASGGVCN